jgi:hypothetical protein
MAMKKPSVAFQAVGATVDDEPRRPDHLSDYLRGRRHEGRQQRGVLHRLGKAEQYDGREQRPPHRGEGPAQRRLRSHQ